MLVPKLFRWLFFRKKLVTNAFDALRNENTVYVDTGVNLHPGQENYPGSVIFRNEKINEFKSKFNNETVFVLFGNSRQRAGEVEDMLKNEGFQQVFYVGTVEELKKIKENL